MPTSKTAPVLAALAVLYAAQPVPAQEPNHHAREARSSPSLSIPTDQVRYKDLGSPQLGTVWGDAAKGPHGSFLRLPKGFISPAHLHTGDYYGIVVAGTVTNAEAGQPEMALGPGSYYFQRGMTDHVTKCLGETDCVIYISQSKAFDFIITKN